MAAKITRGVLESYFACKFKAHLKLIEVQGIPSEYLNMIHDEDRCFKSATEQRLITANGGSIVPVRVPLTQSLLRAGLRLILGVTFEDEQVQLEFDGIMKVDGVSGVGQFYYLPVLFHDGRTVRQPQRQLLEVYAAVLARLSGQSAECWDYTPKGRHRSEGAIAARRDGDAERLGGSEERAEGRYPGAQA